MAAPMLTVQVIALDGEAEKSENEAPKPFRFPDKSVRHAVTGTRTIPLFTSIHENVMK